MKGALVQLREQQKLESGRRRDRKRVSISGALLARRSLDGDML